ncbi:MAG: helicase-associated domain-containing protein [Bradymonadaceae bacterium]|nr:helicase-associated domain-containing protein [Lujinxingiaceae bacterium]
MRGSRIERFRGQSGPLDKVELEGLFERGYNTSSKRFLATAWGLDPDKTTPEQLAEVMADGARLDARLGTVSPLQQAALGHVAANGGRLRGESLRRDLLLRGFGETSPILRDLVERGLLVPLPSPGEGEFDIDQILDHEHFLQHDLAVGEALLARFSNESSDAGPEALGSFSGSIRQTVAPSVDSLELNLLHLTSLLGKEALRLNKSGTPNRRSLSRVARGVTLPGQPGEAADELDLSDPIQQDYLTFLLALSVELGLVEQHGHSLIAATAAVEKYFGGDELKRDRALLLAIQNIKFWSEIKSLALSAGRPRVPAAEQFSQFEATGEPLIGARGYVLSVLKRARLEGWTPLDALVTLCAALDRSYLTRVIARSGEDLEPEDYIEAVIRRALVWMGFLQLGESDDGMELARFHARGRQALGLVSATPAPPAPSSLAGCLIVQPNFEIMVFLDAAPLEVIYFLYRIGERIRLSDRVATFRLTAESVQRGYSLGESAANACERLGALSHTPVPNSVSFQLDDWERVHRQLRFYARGLVLRHPDPDRLELISGQLQHDLGKDGQTLRVGPTAVFVMTEREDLIARLVEREGALLVDYLGTLPACIEFAGPMVLATDRLGCDLVTSSELARIGEELEEQSNATTRFFRLDVKRIQARWSEGALQGVLAFLDARIAGGVPAAQALRLQSLLDRPARARLLEDVTVIVLESAEVADRFAAVPQCATLVEERLGDRAFSVYTGSKEKLNEIFEELGIQIGDGDV